MAVLKPFIDDMMLKLSDKDKAVASWNMAQGSDDGRGAGWVSVQHPHPSTRTG